MKHRHYFKASPFENIDVYRVLILFNVADPCLQHAVKKLLVAGGRGAGKSAEKDIQEAIDTLHRWQAMREEEDLSNAKLLHQKQVVTTQSIIVSSLRK